MENLASCQCPVAPGPDAGAWAVPHGADTEQALLDQAGINIEYLYAFLTRTEKHAYVVLRVEDNDGAKNALSEAGFKLVQESDIQKL